MKVRAGLSALILILGLQPPRLRAQESALRFTQLSRETIDSRLRQFGGNNDQREVNLQKIFAEAGCDGERFVEQQIQGRKQKNLVCTLQGNTGAVFIIGAHFDYHEEYGKGVVDNWSGASLLPSLFEGLKSQTPKHTFRFIGFAEEEKGLIGSTFYTKQLKPEEIENIRLMIDLDSLGLGPTKIWLTHSDRTLASGLKRVADALNLPLEVVNADQVGDEDSTPFRKLHIPTVMLHSITQQTLSILHSPNDNIGKISFGDYYDTYRLVAAFLAYLESQP
jgi:Peptidase family M28